MPFGPAYGTGGSFTGVDFRDVPANHVPYVDASGTAKDSGLVVDPSNLNLKTEETLTVGSNTLRLDRGHAMSSSVENVGFRNLFNDTNYAPVWGDMDTAGDGAFMARRFVGSRIEDNEEEAVKTDTLASPTWSFTPSINARFDRFTVELAAATSRAVLEVNTPSGDNIWHLDLGAQTAGVISFDIHAGDTTPIDLTAGTEYQISLPGASYLGNSTSGRPWQLVTFRQWEDKPIAMKDETSFATTEYDSAGLYVLRERDAEWKVVKLSDGTIATPTNNASIADAAAAWAARTTLTYA